MATPILNITELFSNQKDQFAVVNEGLRQMEAAGNDLLAVDLSSGNETLTSTQFRRHFLFDATGHSVARELTVPQQKRFFAVRNGGTGELSVVRGSTSHVVPADQAGIFYADGGANGLHAIASGGGDDDEVADSKLAEASISSGAVDLSDNEVSVWVVSLTENVTSITLPSVASGRARQITVLFVQDSTGGRTVTGWSGSPLWEGGSEPTVGSEANRATSVSMLMLGSGVTYGYAGTELWSEDEWSYRQKITIAASNVGSDLTDFPLKITQDNLDSGFWDNVGPYGADILVTDDNDNRLDRELVHIDRARQVLLLYVRVPLISSSSETEVRLYYGSDGVVGNTSGVWGNDSASIIHPQDPKVADSTGNNSVTVGASGSSWKRPTQLRETANSGDVGVHQGVATVDGSEFWLFDTNDIKRANSSWVTQATNSDPAGDLTASVDHVGDGDVYDGTLYLPMVDWGSGCGTMSNQTIAEFDAETLAYITEHDVSANGHEVDGLVIEPDEDRITVVDYCDSGNFYRYRLSTMEFLGATALSESIVQAQGITRLGDYYYITSDTDEHDWIYRVRLDGTVEGVIYAVDNDGHNNAEGISTDGASLFFLFDSLPGGDQAVLTLDFVDGAYFKASGLSDGTYIDVALDSHTPDGTVSVWFTRDDTTQRNFWSYSADNASGDPNDKITLAVDDGDKLAVWGSNGTGWLYMGVDPAIDTLHGCYAKFESGGSRSIGHNGGDSTNSDSAGTTPSDWDHLYIGVDDLSLDAFWLGEIHEMRFRSVVLSDDWLAFEDLNVRTPGSSYSAAAEESGSFVV